MQMILRYQVHVEFELVHNQWVFACKPKVTSKSNTASEMTRCSYDMIKPQNAEPFQIITMQPHIVVSVEKRNTKYGVDAQSHCSPRSERALSQNGAKG